MDNKKIMLTVFVVISLVHLYVPGKMIWDREAILKSGTEYRFRTLPIDPYDPFRGKYLRLDFANNRVPIPDGKDWAIGESIYVSLTSDKEGFAQIFAVTKTKPADNPDVIKATVRDIASKGSDSLIIEYPFNRYYMEESKALEAEITFRKFQLDTSKSTYALVLVKNGEAVLKDVLIDGISIREIVKSIRE